MRHSRRSYQNHRPYGGVVLLGLIFLLLMDGGTLSPDARLFARSITPR